MSDRYEAERRGAIRLAETQLRMFEDALRKSEEQLTLAVQRRNANAEDVRFAIAELIELGGMTEYPAQPGSVRVLSFQEADVARSRDIAESRGTTTRMLEGGEDLRYD